MFWVNHGTVNLFSGFFFNKIRHVYQDFLPVSIGLGGAIVAFGSLKSSLQFNSSYRVNIAAKLVILINRKKN